jgi:hypothetical protein
MDRSKHGLKWFQKGEPTEKDKKIEYNPVPTPAEILQSVLSREKFLGLKICWDVIISDTLFELNRDEIVVLTMYTKKPVKVWLTINVKEQPEVLRFASGKVVTVKGEIQMVHEDSIHVERCMLRPVL